MWNNKKSKKKKKKCFPLCQVYKPTIINILNYISKKWTNIQEASG